MIYYINANTQPQELESGWNEQTSRVDEDVLQEHGLLENTAPIPSTSAQTPAEDEHYIMWGADLKAGSGSQSDQQMHNTTPPPPPPPLLHRLGHQQQGDYKFR